MDITLNRLGLGQQAVVTSIDGDVSFVRRLRAYGMIPGTIVCCRYRSPGGSVTSLDCRGSVIALRTKDMQRIWGRCL